MISARGPEFEPPVVLHGQFRMQQETKVYNEGHADNSRQQNCACVPRIKRLFAHAVI
jgi:hypothetical protein